MAIPSVVQGTIKTEDGKVFELDSSRGVAWLETIGSFRFEPIGNGKPCTVRREGSGYWYGCRKVAGKVRKKYIGKTSEVSTAKLEEIAEALEVPPVPRIAQVAEVAQEVAQDTQVTEKVAEVAQDRLTALELEVASLRKALEALREALPGKSEAGDFEELPKVDSKVAEELQNELSNPRNELSNLGNELSNLGNEKIRADYDALLESSTVVTKKLQQEVQELRSQLETEKSKGEEMWEELSDTEQALAEVRSENSELKKTCAELRSELATQTEPTPQHKLYAEIEELKERNRLLIIKSKEERQALQEKISALEYRDESQSRRLAEKQNLLDELEAATELSDLKQKSATVSKDLPEAAELLNQLKTRRKKSKADLTDLEVILEILES
jgi:DNA repair exonuclease SbcCD ATPase subunit